MNPINQSISSIYFTTFIQKKLPSTEEHVAVFVQVCDRGAPLALLELLVSAGVHEQQLRGALTVCVRRGDDHAVTLLLGRLGLDHTNNALCLGSFRLGQMKPTWLSALLSECRTQSPTSNKNSESVHMIWQCLILFEVWHVFDLHILGGD